ncbi:hypothetical protein CZ771_02565 [Actinomycetales bacterium JB111]|nr:hypothetical protein CZ771_02565 [Actinomycetales bacterium JB111]
MRGDEAPAELHRVVAGRFGAVVDAVPAGDWDAPTPVDGWVARDVVGHLTTWLPALLRSAGGPQLADGPSAGTDPVGAWRHQAAAVQDLLDDPSSEDVVLSSPNFGSVPLPRAISQFYTGDVFMHTWDLARATGQDVELDPELCAAMLAGMPAMEEAMRSSGQFGPAVPVPDGASAQDRLIGFIGRDPAWRP